MKFKNTFRVESTRARFWDYSTEGLYFITICTKANRNFFGIIRDAEVELSPIGILAEKFWLEIPEHFPFVELDEFVVMPNHLHGILAIAPSQGEVEKLGGADERETPESGVCTRGGGKNSFWKPGSLGVIINSYKRIVTIKARKINPLFAWHGRYHDHIIRHPQALELIQLYILNNPSKWEEDRYFSR